MKNKEKTISAIKQLMEHYLNEKGTMLCPLCLIFNYGKSECKGCPNEVFEDHCLGSLTYGKLMADVDIEEMPTPGKTHPRFLFWQEALPIIEKLPNEAFTVKGYKDKYFKPLIEINQRIYNNYMKTKS